VALEPVSFDALPGWQNDNHLEAFEAFRTSARRMAARPYSTKAMGVSGELLSHAAALALNSSLDNADGTSAQRFFEQNFTPYRMVAENTGGRKPGTGMVTGYFEPEAEASFERDERFRFPIYRRPADLAEIDETTRPAGMADHFFFARKTGSGYAEYPDRRAIESGALDGQGLELVWLEDLTDIFFIHIQGSARLRMTDGSVLRISYNGKSGHPFTAIGRLLIERGEIAPQDISMQAIRDWLTSHPDEAREVMWENRSFIFFQTVDHPQPELGPVAAAGVPLTAGRSLAVDHRLHTFGTPLWVTTEKPIAGIAGPFARLMIAQDTGSAITGPVRGDLFIGSGATAGEIAGRVSHDAQMYVLMPKPELRREAKA
jgi:membrane-bound lytic murein transglycosylase A